MDQGIPEGQTSGTIFKIKFLTSPWISVMNSLFFCLHVSNEALFSIILPLYYCLAITGYLMTTFHWHSIICRIIVNHHHYRPSYFDLIICSGYPLDHQSCKFLVRKISPAFKLMFHLNSFWNVNYQVGSYIHDNTQIMFDGKYAHDVENQRAQQYILGCTNLGPNDTTIDWANKSFSQTGFQVI